MVTGGYFLIPASRLFTGIPACRPVCLVFSMPRWCAVALYNGLYRLPARSRAQHAQLLSSIGTIRDQGLESPGAPKSY
jgi:hypothetical protein